MVLSASDCACKLCLQAAENLQIAVHLAWQLPDILSLELPNLLFLRFQALLRRRQLVFEELGVPFRFLLPHFQIFVDEQVRQLAGDALSYRGIAAV